jgi:peptidoglycan-associated lipoprotein
MRRLAFLAAGLGLVLAVAGCAAMATVLFGRAGLDISGRWSGTWIGHGILSIPREERATADFEQRGRVGRGVVVLDGTLAAESVPEVMRSAGATGARVLFRVSGKQVTVRHELGSDVFVADFRIAGDRMVGQIRDADPPVRIVLVREQPMKPVEPGKPLTEPSPVPGGTPSGGGPNGQPAHPGSEPPVAAAPSPGETAPDHQPGSTLESAPTDRPLPTEFTQVRELQPVHFAFDKADIRPEETAGLEASARWLRENDVLVLIEGHADERGTAEYNVALGERRAKSVRDYLVERGVEADRVNTMSYGEERPVCSEATEECWQSNRRTELLVKRR